MLNDPRGTAATRRIPGMVVGVSVTVLLGFFTLRGVDFAGMLVYVESADPRWLVAVAAANVLADVFRSLRWGVLLEPIGATPVGVRLRAVLAGSAGNHLFPLRLGEVIRVHTLHRHGGPPFVSTFTTLVVERAFDVVGILFVFGACLVCLPGARELDPELEAAIGVLTALVIVFVAVVAFCLVHRKRTGAWIKGKLSRYDQGRMKPVVKILDQVLAGLGSLGRGRQVVVAMVFTILMWMAFGLSFACGLLSLDLATGGGTLVARSALVLVFVSVFTMVPAAVGLLGTFQAGCVVALAVFGVSREHSLGFSVVVHAVQFATCVAVGSPFVLASVRRPLTKPPATAR